MNIEVEVRASFGLHAAFEVPKLTDPATLGTAALVRVGVDDVDDGTTNEYVGCNAAAARTTPTMVGDDINAILFTSSGQQLRT